MRKIPFFIIMILIIPGISISADIEGCMDCHSLGLITTNMEGRSRTISIDSKSFTNSPHGGTYCSDCHTDAAYLPHTAKPEEISCTEKCHTEEVRDKEREVHREKFYAYQKDPHFISDITCKECHNSTTWGDKLSASMICLDCHYGGNEKERKILLSTPVHGNLVGERAIVVCVDCHSPHVKRDEESDVGQSKSSCYLGQECHGKGIFKKVYLGGHVETDSSSASFMWIIKFLLQSGCALVVILGGAIVYKRKGNNGT